MVDKSRQDRQNAPKPEQGNQPKSTPAPDQGKTHQSPASKPGDQPPVPDQNR